MNQKTRTKKDHSIWAVCGVLLSVLFIADTVLAQTIQEDDYDRLDGKGKSLMRVDVIEWEGNLELHFYPKGRLKGLGFKIDRTKKDKPVMVISYRFHPPAGRTLAAGEDKPLIRRAILGIPLKDSFQVYQDPTVSDYDKIVVSNHKLGFPLIAFTPDAPPTELYPEGHPMNSGSGSVKPVAIPSSAPSSLDLAVPKIRDALFETDDLNPELRVKPRTGLGSAPTLGENNRAPAAITQPSKFQHPKVDENTSDAIRVKELNLNQGFNW